MGTDAEIIREGYIPYEQPQKIEPIQEPERVKVKEPSKV